MLRPFCRAKLHRLTITEADLQYVGSLTLDPDLLDAGGLLPYEQVQVVNLNTGSRLETYVIPGRRGSGTVCLNGAAARLGAPGDIVIVIVYAWLEAHELDEFSPRVVFVDEHNQVTRVDRPELTMAEPALGS